MITVLYVDDEPELLEITRAFLEQDGEFQVSISTSAREALNSGSVSSCDAIVSDYQMPEMDGIAFLREVRERFTDLPFILFTGRGREEVVIEALNYGADFYIQKGGEPKAQFTELSNKIRYAVSRKRAEKELQRKNDELNASYEQIAANEEELRQQLDELTGKQEAIKNSEEKFRAFTENIPDLTTIVDVTGSYTYISPSVQRITGWTWDKLLKKKFQEIDAVFGILPEDAEILTKCGRNAIQKPGETIPVPPFRVRDVKGDILFIEGTISYLPAVKGIQGLLFHGREISDRVRNITEKKRAEEALYHSQQMLQIVLDTIPERVFWKDKNSVFLGCNKPNALDAGFSDPAEMVGKTDYDYTTPEMAELYRADDRHVMETGEARVNYEEPQVRPDGSRAWLRTSKVPLHDKQGQVIGVLGTYEDITEQKRNEEALRESEETFRRVIEGAPDAIYIGADWKFVFVNPAALRLFGATSGEQLVGTPFMDRIHPRFHDAIKGRVHQLYDELVPAPLLDEVYLKLDGTEVDVEVSSVPFRYMGRDGALVFVRDISGWKQAERARRESEEKYRNILEKMQDAYLRIGVDGTLAMANPAAARMFGYDSPEKMIGIPAISLYNNPGRRPEIIKTLQEGGRVADVTERMVRIDNTTFWASLSVQSIRGDDGSIIATEGILRDITERKSMEQAIREANRKLNLLNSINRHDIANQLTVLQGYTQMAAMKAPDPVIADFLEKIEATADTITRQIEFTKAYQELGAETPAWFRLDETVERSGRAEVKFSKTCQAIEIFSDPMLERVFYNLFENAIRHGGHVTEIAVRCEREPDGLVIIIEDNGVGVVPEEKEKIFEKGFGKNTGFGLFLAREILAITGITIRETGYAGVGARFEITVPAEIYRIGDGS